MTHTHHTKMRSRRVLVHAGLLALLLLLALAGTSAASTARAPRRGGTIIVDWQTSLATLDPAFVYSVTDWPQTHAVSDGLLGFDAGTGLVPDLAESMPKISNGGKTYTFRLRKGLVYSNGDPIKAQDFVFSWERELAPKTQSSAKYLWYVLAGQDAFTAGKAKHISGLKVLDDRTLQVTTSQAYPGFLYVLAIPASYVVDPAVVHKYHAENTDLKDHVVGAGPFMIKDWVEGQKLDLVRNPHFWNPKYPYADAVHEDLGVDASVALDRLQKGQTDLIGDGIPAAQFPSVISDPKLSKLVEHRTDVGVYMLTLNVKVKPFDNKLVRQAVAYAINKLHAIRFINGRGVPATGIIPSTMPGFSHNIPDPYPYNPQKAKELLAKAGYPHGFTTTLGLPDAIYERRVGDAAIADLKQVGITVNVKKVVSEFSGDPSLPMSSYHWLMDYPDPADFVDGFTACASAVNGGSNVAFYCNKTVDDLANAARGMPFGPARVAKYKQIEQLVADDAAYIPVFYDVLYGIHSPRLQGFTIHPIWYPFALEQYWLSS
ncbi:MAG TPA: ABC transporter substrate-binding protein [Chloroflexota bacterium]|nr:ABC transporter substrate-binding protein [Chloroflexota bacterium]